MLPSPRQPTLIPAIDSFVAPLDQIIDSKEIIQSKIDQRTQLVSLTCNSREVKEGSLFFAIRGKELDGTRFISDALNQGAAGVVVDQFSAFSSNPKTILVKCVRDCLGLAASTWNGNPTNNLNLIGITGTNGKTTTTYILQGIWDTLGLESGVIGTVEYFVGKESFPSQLTTPGPLELQKLLGDMVKENVSHAALEVSSIALDQKRVRGCNFKVGLFTNLTQDHLDYHGNFEDYYLAKRSFFTDYQIPIGIFNIDDASGERLYYESQTPDCLSISLHKTHADFRVEDTAFSTRGTRAKVITPRGNFALFSPLIGKHNLYNNLFAIAVSHLLEQDLEMVFQALTGVRGAPGRLERAIPKLGRPNIFVDYAHTPDALAQVLLSLRELRTGMNGKMITVFGCGGDRDCSKRPKMAEIVSLLSDITITTSDNPRSEDPNKILDDIERGIQKHKTLYYREVDRRKAIHLALSFAESDDFVLIAGKGHETFQLVGNKKLNFDDRKVIRDFYV